MSIEISLGAAQNVPPLMMLSPIHSAQVFLTESCPVARATEMNKESNCLAFKTLAFIPVVILDNRE